MRSAPSAPPKLLGSNAERLALRGIDLQDLTEFVEDTGNSYRWDGSAWWQTGYASGTSSVDLMRLVAGTSTIGGITGTGIMVAASVDVNTAIAADVDAAVAAQTGLRLIGFACRESAGAAAAATFIIVHGATGAGGTPMVPVELAANESTREWFGPDGIACASGISIDWIAGTVDVELFYKVVA